MKGPDTMAHTNKADVSFPMNNSTVTKIIIQPFPTENNQLKTSTGAGTLATISDTIAIAPQKDNANHSILTKILNTAPDSVLADKCHPQSRPETTYKIKPKVSQPSDVSNFKSGKESTSPVKEQANVLPEMLVVNTFNFKSEGQSGQDDIDMNTDIKTEIDESSNSQSNTETSEDNKQDPSQMLDSNGFNIQIGSLSPKEEEFEVNMGFTSLMGSCFNIKVEETDPVKSKTEMSAVSKPAIETPSKDTIKPVYMSDYKMETEDCHQDPEIKGLTSKGDSSDNIKTSNPGDKTLLEKKSEIDPVSMVDLEMETESISHEDEDIEEDSDEDLEKIDNEQTEAKTHFQCVYCDQCFDERIKRSRHIRKEHKGDKIPCKHCGILVTKCALKRHIRVRHENVKKWACKICSQKFYLKGPCKEHINTMHKNVSPLYYDMPLIQPILPKKQEKPVKNKTCDDCGQLFPSQQLLNQHTNSEHKPNKCPECNESFWTSKGLECHIQAAHNKPELVSGVENDSAIVNNESVCAPQASQSNVQAVQFPVPENMESVNTVDNNFQHLYCVKCGQPFSTSPSDTCQHIYSVPLNLQQVRKFLQRSPGDNNPTPQKEGKYHCNECNKSFQTVASFDRHYKVVHKKLKPFKCTEPDCSSSFGNSTDLARHINGVHKQIKPFTCNLCQKTFFSKQNLVVHVDSIHNNVKAFKCTVCDKPFASKGYLVKHIDTVHIGLKYSCSVCSKAYKCKKYLRKHQKEQHPNVIC